MSRLPKHITPRHLYFHMPLPRNVLLFYSDCCADTYYPGHFGSLSACFFFKSRTWWYVLAYLHAPHQLTIQLHPPGVFYLYITSPDLSNVFSHLPFSCKILCHYPIDRGIGNTSRQISFEFLFIKTRPPNKLHYGFGFVVQFRVGIWYLNCQGGKFW